MNSKKDFIIKYNELLIKYLNDLVNDFEQDTEFNKHVFENVTNRLKAQLSSYGINFNDDTIKLIMSQAFREYANILKVHFDHSNIHRIDQNHSEDENLPNEMNEITTNLSNAVNNMNKTSEYATLIKKIKDSMVYHFKQTSSNYQGIEFEIEQILNDAVVITINNFISGKIEDFFKYTLPDLYKIGDEITRVVDVTKVVEENINVNAERDQFIYETMNVEIHEGFENGMVTLTAIDEMGQQQMYIGRDAMEKLTSYNQLFEASRPGKKVDTSKWPNIDEVSENNPLSNPNNIVDSSLNQMNFNPTGETVNLNNTSNNTPQVLEEKNDNEQLIRNFLSKYNDDNDSMNNTISNTNDPNNQAMFNLTDGFNNLTVSSIEDNDNNSNNTNLNEFNSTSILNLTDNFNNLNDNNNTSNESSFGGGFLPTFDNPNSDRDEFIRNSTGILLEEDKDNQNNLYLKVIEPTGREIVYTGKEAVKMIKNYNKVYLDANPGGIVDTSLIDSFIEN